MLLPIEGSIARKQETLNKNKLISGKKFAGLRGISSIVGMIVLVLFIVTLGLAWTSSGYLLRAVRRKSRKQETPLDWYAIPGRRLGFDAGASAFAAPTMGPSV